MKRLHYVGASVIVDDDLAATLLDLAAALSRLGLAEPVQFRARNVDGLIVEVDFLIGPSSQIFFESIPAGGEPIDNSACVASMRQRIESLRDPRPVYEAPGSSQDFH